MACSAGTLNRWMLGLLLLSAAPMSALARHGLPPYSLTHSTQIKTSAPELVLAPVNPSQLLAEDEAQAGIEHPALTKRLRIAAPNAVDINPSHDGVWQSLPQGARLWRWRVTAVGATDLHFGFNRFELPPGATLHLLSANETDFDGPYTQTDNNATTQFWSPLIPGSSATLELYLPAGSTLAEDTLQLSYVGTGYRDMFERNGPSVLVSGACNIDVVCPLGEPYRDEIRAVARYTFHDTGGTFLCSGTLMMDQPRDFKNYFLTANHCISSTAAAASMTLYWNYQSPTCGAHGGGSLAQSQTGGASYRAGRHDVDFSLVELSTTPAADYNVYYAGWDVSGMATGGSIGIHHPSGYVKAITQNTLPLLTVDSCIGTDGVNTHWQTGPYAQGTTEGGSSGSAILVPAADGSGHQRLVIGTLSGGGAACNGSVPNNEPDCYGKLSVAWLGGSSDAQRLKPWLDPNNTLVQTVDGGQQTLLFNSLLVPGKFSYHRLPIAPNPKP